MSPPEGDTHTSRGALGDAAQVIIRMKEVMGLRSDTELAQRLRLSKTTVSPWRRRNSIPYKEAVDVGINTGASISYILNGVGQPYKADPASVPDEEIFRAILSALVRFKDLSVKGRRGDQREAAVAVAAREFFVYYRNAQQTLHELMEHGMSYESARAIVVRSLLNPRTDEVRQ